MRMKNRVLFTMFVTVLVGSVLSSPASAQLWTEAGDAPSFPDGAAQVTRGGDLLDTIIGSTGGSDLRDAYCIKIVDPSKFLATTDPATAPGASGDFDTRLFLFRPDGAPLLANDNTPPSGAPFLSTVTGVATDGSGSVLSKPGEYVLIVGGFSDHPLDAASTDLFVLSPFDVVAAPNPSAGSFNHWQGGTSATGNYTIVLTGVDPCQNDLDAVFANFNAPNRVCLGNGSGGSPSCADASDHSFTESVALGFVNDDGELDAVFGNTGENRVCLGNGSGGFSACADVSGDTFDSRGTALGFVTDDGNLDAVFANFSNANRVCLGNGSGSFPFCADAGDDSGIGTKGVALGFVDDDGNLDAVFANFNAPNRVCLGDGSGGFSSCADVSVGSGGTQGVALGLVNDDGDLDAVFANIGTNRVCLGNGSGGFSGCTDASSDSFDARGVALGLVNDDGNLDAVFANIGTNRVCLGNGSGQFPSCADVSGDTFETRGGVALGEVGSNEIFVDGFESSDTSAWSSTVP